MLGSHRSREGGRQGSNTSARRGFTLVELLVVIGIIAVLISILLPTLGRAQRAAKTIQCAGNMRSIVQGVQLYAAAYGGAIVGSPHTSSAHVRTAADISGSTTARYARPGTVAVTDDTLTGVSALFDWQAPIAKMLKIPFDEGAGAAVRRQRFLSLMQNRLFTCPEQQIIATPFGDTSFPIITHPSYATNIDFLLMRNETGGNGTGWGIFFGRNNDWNMPQGYVPRITKIGNASRKVFLTEGVRFVTTAGVATYTSTGVTNQQHGGAYSDQRPYNALANNRSKVLVGNYGDAAIAGYGSDSPATILTAFRHGNYTPRQNRDSYRANVAFFDGHVETLPVTEMMNPEFHSPKGTEITTNSGQVYPIVRARYFQNRDFTYIVP